MPEVPEHWEDQAPNESEPQTFIRNSPTVLWWILGALAIFTVIGLTAAWITQRESDEPNSTENVAGARDETHEVTFTGDRFEPADVDVPRNQRLVLINNSNADCLLMVEGSEGMGRPVGEVGSAPRGGEVTWVAEEPGQYAVRCEGAEGLLRVTVP